MDTNKTNQKTNNKKLIFPILILLLVVAGYFVYQGFFAQSDDYLDNGSNTYIINTKLGKDVDIVNKEAFSFTSSFNNRLNNNIDFSITISQSPTKGRTNPFLP